MSGALTVPDSVGEVDVGGHRQPNGQRVVLELGRVESDAHRQALHDLDPVAGGILGRHQRESRTGAAGEARDMTTIDDIAARRDRTSARPPDQRAPS